MAPANCAEGTGWMLISSDPARHQALQGALQAMTGKGIYLGPQPERAAAFKLFGNLTLLGLLGILGDVGRLAAAVGDGAGAGGVAGCKRASRARSGKYLRGAQQQGLWQREAERLGRLQVDRQLELGWLLDGQIVGARASQDLVDERCGGAEVPRVRRVVVH